MSVELTCEITIGDYLFTEANSVTIRSGRNLLVGTARIILANIDTAISNPTVLDNAINVDDPVTIKLGYDGDNKLEFTGFVKEKRPNAPFEILCEDAMRDMRTPFSKNYAAVKLIDLIKELVPDAHIYALPEITLTDFRVNKATKLQVLNEVKNTYPGIDIYYRNGVMYAGYPYLEKGGNHIYYHLQDTIQKHDMVFTKEGDLKIRVEAISMMADGSKVELVVGDAGGDSTTLHYTNLPEAELKKQAEIHLKQLKIRGYKGTVTTWGIPFAKHGDIAEWEDRFYPTRRQANFIDEVTVEWGLNGFKRILKPGLKARNEIAA